MANYNFHEGLMTQATYDLLQQKLIEIQAKITQNQLEQGQSIENAADWHDNAAYDMLIQALRVLNTQENQIVTRLRNAEIIQPRTDTSKVGIGNTVLVQYPGEEPETFTILGVADSATRKDWISGLSPLGKALLEKRAGDIVNLPQNVQVTILQVLAGDF